MDRNGVVLVLDYPGRRAEAPVSSLDLQASGYTVRHLLEPPHVRELTARAYAERLLDRYGPFPRVRAVLAYCMAGPIAQEVAALLGAANGVGPPLVLFDGEPATVEDIAGQYRAAGANLGALLNLDEADWTPPPAFDDSLLRDDPAEAVRRIRRGLLDLGGRAVTRGSDDPDAARADAEAVTEFYLDWLCHLVAAHNSSWPAWGGPAVQIVSRDQPCPPQWPGAAQTRTIRVQASRVELLSHPEVADVVRSILKEAHDGPA